MTSGPPGLSAGQTVPASAPGASAVDHGSFAPGTVLADRYRIIGLLGRGGMGEVYRADDLTLGQSVALKFLPPHVSRDPGSLERLLSEVRTARQVSHPNVCRVHDVGDDRGRRFISMEYIDGEDLSVLLRRIGRLAPDKGVETAHQLCAGLAASHERGVLHRDLKPANVMLDGRGRVRITDFGLATALRSDGSSAGEFAGTPAYMAPEQLEGKPVSVETDIYALGLVLYEIFTGRRFHDVASIDALRERHARLSSPDLSASDGVLEPALRRVIERCLDPEPHRRPPSCRHVAAALPGGDPLEAAIAAGETPSPQLVAAAGGHGGLSPRTAAMLGAAFVTTVGLLAWAGPNPPAIFGMTRSAEALSIQTRDWLSSLGYPGRTDVPADQAAGFSYRYEEWRAAAATPSSRPWSRLRELRPAPVFFWYREHPSGMIGSESGRLGLEEALAFAVRGVAGVGPHDPPYEPGSVYVERGPNGSLDTLMVRPPSSAGTRDAGAGQTPREVDWSRLFAEARLDMAEFAPAPPDPALSMAGTRRLAWSREAAPPAGPLRVEAAEAGGLPVAFRVLSPRTRLEPGSISFAVPDSGDSSSAATLMYVGFSVFGYLGALFLVRRNFVLGRGDRRGAARVAGVVGVLVFVAAWLVAKPPLDSRVFGTLHGAAALALFAAAWCWAFYVAIEPLVRRRWPRMLIGWSRLIAGEWRDPLVGREIFVGGLAAALIGALDLGAAQLALWQGEERPLRHDFFFRALGGPADVSAAVLQLLPWTIFAVLLWMVLLIILRRFLRHDAAAMLALAVLSLGVTAGGPWVFVVATLAVNLTGLMLALRVGFLAVASFVVVSNAISTLPFAPADPGFVGTLSWLPVAVAIVPPLAGLYTSLAGQSIFGHDAG